MGHLLDDAKPMIDSCQLPFANGMSDEEILRLAHRQRPTSGPPPERVVKALMPAAWKVGEATAARKGGGAKALVATPAVAMWVVGPTAVAATAMEEVRTPNC